MEEIIERINHIEQYPLMYLKDQSFDSLTSFITGYLMGIDEIRKTKLNYDFSEWLNNKGKKTSIYWVSYIYLILAQEDQNLAYKLVFDNLKEFLSSR